MIVRRDGDSWLLIRQPDHALMASEILTRWVADGLPDRPTRDVVLRATRLHDIGWTVEDDEPGVDPETGAPWDFIHLATDRRQEVWRRAVRLLSDDPHVAALVAHHAVTAYARYEGDAAWRPFFQEMSGERDRRVSDLAAAPGDGVSFDMFLRDYALLRAADLVSLTLCHGWSQPFEIDYYRAVPEGAHLTVTPDPFGGATVVWRVPARRVSPLRFASDESLRAACASAPIEWLTGSLTGAPSPLPV